MDKNSIIEMLSIGENKEIEFKESKNKISKSLWETYSAFCNSKGGIIVLGIKENKENDICTIEGIENANHILKDFWNTINNREKISVNVLDDEDVKIVDIEENK